MATDCSIILTSAASDAMADSIADRLLSDRLAACVQVLPMRSAYVWKGQIAREEERLLLIKAKTADWPAIEAAMREIHDYETPEIVRIEMAEAAQTYLDWIVASTR